MISKVDQLGYSTNFSYDNLGNQVSTTDPNGNTTNYNFDKLNRLKEEVHANGSKTSYGRWCEKNDFLYCTRVIPEKWLKKRGTNKHPELIQFRNKKI